MQCNDFLFIDRQRDIGYLHRPHRLQPVERLGYITLGFIAYVLTDDFSLVCHTKQHRTAITIQKSAKRFHSTLQLTGSFFELHLSAFSTGYQFIYYIEAVYLHISFINRYKDNAFNGLYGI